MAKKKINKEEKILIEGDKTKEYKPKIRMELDSIIILPLMAIFLLLKPGTISKAFGESFEFMAVVVPYLPLIIIGWLAYKLIYVMRLSYMVEDKGNITKTHGVLGRFRQDIPYKRITNIHKNRSWLDRILGLTSIGIQTAGSDKIEMTLGGLTCSDGEEIYSKLQKFKGIGDGT